MAATHVEVRNWRKLEKKLAAFPKKARNAILRKALRKGAKIVRDEARRLVPRESGLLRKNIKVRAGKRSRRKAVSIRVNIGEGMYTGETFYGAFVELGHRAGPRRLGSARATVPPQPFMRPALKNKERAVTAEVHKTVVELIAQERSKT